MQLHLTRLDLKVEFRGTIARGQIKVYHFEPQVQQAIKAVGNLFFHDNYDPDIQFVISNQETNLKE